MLGLAAQDAELVAFGIRKHHPAGAGSAGGAEGEAYLDAVAYARAATPTHPSIVNGQIAAAVAGEFGDVYFTERTARNELFVNPLMSLSSHLRPGRAREAGALPRSTFRRPNR